MAIGTTGNHHREHAEHNEEVYNYLRQKIDYIDWIITTAFYSAIHYVEFKVFPFEKSFGPNTFQITSIDIYHEIVGSRKSKHASRSEIVRNKIPECATAYDDLKSLCQTARYHDYKHEHPKEIDKKVARHLKKIKKACLSPDPSIT
ncbi:MAG: hypothetical protein WD317_11415 [Balneolaceae bacterium]